MNFYESMIPSRVGIFLSKHLLGHGVVYLLYCNEEISVC